MKEIESNVILIGRCDVIHCRLSWFLWVASFLVVPVSGLVKKTYQQEQNDQF